MTGAGGESLLMVKLTDDCKHPESNWKPTACGHPRCELCGGHVDPMTRAVLKDVGPIIACNRKRLPWEEYDLLFEEYFAGSARLTECIKTELARYLMRG